MSIEQAGTAVGAKTSATQDNRSVKARASTAGDSPAGGFSSLLSAMSSTAEPSAIGVDSGVAIPSPATPKKSAEEEEAALLANAVSPPVTTPSVSAGLGASRPSPATPKKSAEEEETALLANAVSPPVTTPSVSAGLGASRPSPATPKKSTKEEEAALLANAVSPPVTTPSVGAGLGASRPSPATPKKSTKEEEAALLANAVSPPVTTPSVDVGAPIPSPTNKNVPEEDASLRSLVRPSEALLAESRRLSPVSPSAGGVGLSRQHPGPQEVGPAKQVMDEALWAPTDLTQASENETLSDATFGVDPATQKLAQARRTQGEDIRADSAKAGLESKAMKAIEAIEASTLDGKEAMLAKLSSTGDFSARLLEPVERPRGKSFGAAGASGAEAGWAQYAHHARTTLDMPSNVNTGMTTPAPTQVADKVSYWVTQGVQNAELKLDGFGSDPVEVTISLKGGEAHVGFRSDQPDVRLMLESALGQLKDALAREGVVLSGVTVGGSGSDGGGRQQEQRRDSNPSHGGGGVAPVASEPRPLRASMSVGRSLDIFV